MVKMSCCVKVQVDLGCSRRTLQVFGKRPARHREACYWADGIKWHENHLYCVQRLRSGFELFDSFWYLLTMNFMSEAIHWLSSDIGLSCSWLTKSDSCDTDDLHYKCINVIKSICTENYVELFSCASPNTGEGQSFLPWSVFATERCILPLKVVTSAVAAPWQKQLMAESPQMGEMLVQ